MESKVFDELADKILAETRARLRGKEGEYVLGKDRLDAFKKAAAIQGVTPAQALCGMMAKHTVSLYDRAMSGDFPREMLFEKAVDHIAYIVLLCAVLEDGR